MSDPLDGSSISRSCQIDADRQVLNPKLPVTSLRLVPAEALKASAR